MQRRTYRLTGADGHFDVEVQRIEGGALEVSETDDMGRQVQPVFIVHTWDEARARAAALLGLALTEGRI